MSKEFTLNVNSLHESTPRQGRKNRDLIWKTFILLLCIALGTEFFDKNPFLITNSIYIPYFRFNLVSFIIFYFSILVLLMRRIDLRFPTVLRPVVLFWFVNQISFLGVIWLGLDPNKIQQFIKTDLNLSLYIIFVCIFLKFVNSQRLEFLLKAYFGLGIFSAAISFLQYTHGNYGLFPWMSDFTFSSGSYRFLGFRASSLYGEASWAARYFVHWIALSLALYSYSKKNIYFIFSIIFGLAFIMTGSLGGLLILLSFITILSYNIIRGKVNLSLGAPKICIILLLLIITLYLILSNASLSPTYIVTTIRRISNVLQGFDSSAFVRLDSSFSAFKVWIISPIFGVGLGNLRFYIEQFFTQEFTFLRSFYTADSYFAIILAECGIIGFIGFSYMIINLLRNRFNVMDITNIKGLEKRRILLKILQIDFAAQTIGLIAYSDVLSPHYWFIITIILSLKKLNR